MKRIGQQPEQAGSAAMTAESETQTSGETAAGETVAAHAEPGPAPSPSRVLSRSQHWLSTAAPYLAISLGGALGANARYLVGIWGVAQWGADFPYATLLINVTGSFILAFYLTLVTERFTGRVTTRLFVTTGFCGAYTTLSTFSVETLQLLATGQVGAALAYVAASLVLGLLAVGLGIGAARAL